MMTDSLGFMFVCEQVTAGNNEVSNIQVVDKNSIFYVEFDTILQSFDILNRNQRYYDGQNVIDCIYKDPKIVDQMNNNGWFGEMDHPFAKKKGEELTPQRLANPDPGNTSHKIIRPRLEGNLLRAHIQTDAGTSAGMNMAKKIIQGLNAAFSARSIAELTNRGGKPYVMMKKLITYDWVLYPSHPEAHMTTPARGVSKSITESAGIDYNQPYTVESVCIPLKEILEHVSTSSVNAQMIMESFELTTENITGYDSVGKHFIMTDESKRIYVNMEPEVHNKLNGILKEFGK